MTITRDVDAKRHADRAEWELLAPVVFTNVAGDTITVPAGFYTDGASVPKIFRSLFDPVGTYFAAAVVHDWLYRNGGVIDFPPYRLSQADADRVFLLACEACGTAWWIRRILYRGVRIGGSYSFRGVMA